MYHSLAIFGAMSTDEEVQVFLIHILSLALLTLEYFQPMKSMQLVALR